MERVVVGVEREGEVGGQGLWSGGFEGGEEVVLMMMKREGGARRVA